MSFKELIWCLLMSKWYQAYVIKYFSHEKGSDLLLTHLNNIIEKRPGSNLKFYIDMDFISQ